MKERPYSDWTKSRLEKHSRLIKKELYLRAIENGGQEKEDFRDIHSLPECKIKVTYLGSKPSGMWYIGLSPNDDYQAYVNIYSATCEHHGCSSRKFSSMSNIREDDLALHVEYPKFISEISKWEKSENKTSPFRQEVDEDNYFVRLEKRAINSGLIANKDSFFEINNKHLS